MAQKRFDHRVHLVGKFELVEMPGAAITSYCSRINRLMRRTTKNTRADEDAPLEGSGCEPLVPRREEIGFFETTLIDLWDNRDSPPGPAGVTTRPTTSLAADAKRGAGPRD
jgi:hypothetical protein